MRTLDRIRDITPIRIPRSATGILLFGGTFDPPHRWHVRVASAVRRRLFGSTGWIVFVPAARSPLKDHGPSASPADRVAMLRLATRRTRNAIVWTDEIDRARRRAGPSYTVDTLDRLGRLLRGRGPFRLLLGADQMVKLHRWKNAAIVMFTAEPAVVWRQPITTRAALRQALVRTGAWKGGLLDWALDLVVSAPTDPMSSSNVRRLVSRMHRTGRTPAGLKRMLDPAVLRYIRANRLYAPPRAVSGRLS